MTVDQLKVAYQECLTNPNYQYKDLDDTQRLKLAVKSFQRLTPEQQKEVQQSWAKAIGKLPKELTEQDIRDSMQYRFLAQTNLFFLCKLLVKYNETTIRTHEDICNKFFVSKDPTVSFRTFAEGYKEHKEGLLMVPRGGFKALDLNTEIATPNGFVLMNDIKVGDVVIGGDGKPCNVVGESAIFEGRDCYEVEFATGEKVVADAEHLWITDSRKDRDRLKGKNNKNQGPKPSIKTTKLIADTLMCRNEHNHRIAVSSPLYLEDSKYTIAPYVLGCWLGDGTSSNSNLTCNDPQIIEEILKEGEIIRKSGYDEILYVANGGPDHIDYRKHTNSLAGRLRNLGVLNNKHIPEVYLNGSYNQRLSLLQGLMDTDGTCDNRGHCTFTNMNRELAHQVRQLVCSLGLKAYNMCEYDAMLNGCVMGRGYQVGFISDINTPVFRLSRKLDRLNKQLVTRSKFRYIVAVNKVDTRPTKCIMVDSPDNTYLVGRSYIKTHNSSVNVADCVQWVICYPEITILIMTATLKLASMFIGELKEHFKMVESRTKTDKGKKKYEIKSFRNEATGQWSPSLFQSLFVEHCIMPDDGLSTEFQTGACAPIDKEPTAMAASIEQTLAGLHYGLLKLDDVVSNENSNTDTRMEEVNKQVSISKGMLHPYGFIDYIGTWYDDADLYGQMLKNDDDVAKEENLKHLQIGSISLGRFNSTVSMRIYVRACWWLTEAALKDGKMDATAKEEDYELWFPERLPFKKLRKWWKSDKQFAIKYLNNPRLIHEVKFPRELMIKRTIDHQYLPQQGTIVMVVDVAYSVKSWADYTVIMVGLVHAGRFYVIDMNRGRFNEHQMPIMIANMAMKWKPKRIAMEDSVGAKWIGKETRRELDKLRILIPIEYIGLGKGSAASSKQVKAQPVLRLLGDERLFFSKGCADLDVIYEELERFGQGTAAHDDIVSGVSLMVQHFGAYADMEVRQQNPVSVEEDRAAAMEKERYNMIYGVGKYSRYSATESNMAFDDHPSTQFQATKGVTEVVTDVDPLSDLLM